MTLCAADDRFFSNTNYSIAKQPNRIETSQVPINAKQNTTLQPPPQKNLALRSLFREEKTNQKLFPIKKEKEKNYKIF